MHSYSTLIHSLTPLYHSYLLALTNSHTHIHSLHSLHSLSHSTLTHYTLISLSHTSIHSLYHSYSLTSHSLSLYTYVKQTSFFHYPFTHLHLLVSAPLYLLTLANIDPKFQLSVVSVYSPNSGQDLKRLDYRLSEWDPQLATHLQTLTKPSSPQPSSQQPSSQPASSQAASSRQVSSQASSRQVLLCGDLNVAHSDADFYNPNEKRMESQAGTTPQERYSFSRHFIKGYSDKDNNVLKKDTDNSDSAVCNGDSTDNSHSTDDKGDSTDNSDIAVYNSKGFGGVDLFRHMHGDDVEGIYSYWSQRARNRFISYLVLF